ncbi:hypothetical protein BA895_22205 [Humibacillus sp. DSM 29435]|uniref:FAD-dependent oxidoreductase n=1 Tax=Humibacillus sp. DSM 29435 TaxID=1869167 RepID=UPI000872BE16|nr:FAD-dependent oxidoreductase [Humibacillus sp. DSM 29435]OFE15620.1 hypothetical protein BA895_22205 [Humibacillus sp. DSM 29435]
MTQLSAAPSAPTSPRRTIVVVGAGLVGLTTAILLARDGHRVTVLDGDPTGPPATPEEAWVGWRRPGVNQFRQPHLMLPRWTAEMARELPDLLTRLMTDGASRVNLLHLQPECVTHGWRPGDEAFDTVTARRPVLEASVSRLASDQRGLTLRRGVRVTGLVADAGTGWPIPHVRGVTTDEGTVEADLVIDAGGRRTPVPAWVRRLGGPDPALTREPGGFVYYGRHYRATDGHLPTGHGPALSHHPSWSILTLPGDGGTYCIVLVTSAKDRALRALREEAVWEAAARTSPVAAQWLQHGIPLTVVSPIAGLEDVSRDYVRDGRPVVTGLVAVGDASAATNPSLGRGAAIGVIQAVALRDVLAAAPSAASELALAYAEAVATRVTPWVDATLRFDRHRLAEIDSDILGVPYATEDPTWAMTTALLNGASGDPVLARASARVAGLLVTPREALSDPEVGLRLGPWLGGTRYPGDGPTRADLLREVATATVRDTFLHVRSEARTRSRSDDDGTRSVVGSAGTRPSR